MTGVPRAEGERILVAHRGASAYAPEHSYEAYQLALDQGADFLEPDLQITRDGILISLHDPTLERTTNVRELFPDRSRTEPTAEGTIRRWYAHDFTLAELKRLDAGSWFDERFRGTSLLTLGEVIEIAAGRAGVFPETKGPEAYGRVGFEMERLLMVELERHSLVDPGGDPVTRVMIQSFSSDSLRILRDELGCGLPLVLLVASPDPDRWLAPEGLEWASRLADGIGPDKRLLLETPSILDRTREIGMAVLPWTFRASDPGSFTDVISEMAHFLYELGVDGLFTDNPDLFPRAPISDGS